MRNQMILFLFLLSACDNTHQNAISSAPPAPDPPIQRSSNAVTGTTTTTVTSTSTTTTTTTNTSVTHTGLAGFKAETGDEAGEIKLTIDFPTTVTDYGSVEIYKLKGETAPSDNDPGTKIKTYQVFTDSEFIDTGLEESSYYTYQAKVLSADGTVLSKKDSESVKPKSSSN